MSPDHPAVRSLYGHVGLKGGANYIRVSIVLAGVMLVG